MARHGLPFMPLEPVSCFADSNGALYQVWTFRCTNLLTNGRCGDYEHRPQLCRLYEPLQDGLCVMRANRLLPAPPAPTELSS